MIEDILKEAKAKMEKTVVAIKQELAKIRTGRAHPSLLDHIRVSYYGSEVPISQVANVAVEDARTLTITPWERNMVAVIEKAIMESDLGINPMTAGTVIRVPLPALTEERRKELVKVARHEAEQGRIAIRNIRREANQELKEALKEKLITEDEERRAEEQIQKLTDDYIKKIDAVLAEKEKDLLSL
ncbi:ribosome recycling factor [Methylomarinovum caldicuralii]|uniref:Ribosome-recycling factor n=1 Tax=Methylomarinovum caldicuralii TaxID=438856 RepID=A0AAU9CDC2_9GAMM|nr:ribosome recycling factor [Methylomarinovum caldicuralii]BCX80945.1 ribosome recycling factor [Methylomarinovum caldicuralii]